MNTFAAWFQFTNVNGRQGELIHASWQARLAQQLAQYFGPGWLTQWLARGRRAGWFQLIAQSAHCLGAGWLAGWLADALVPQGSDQEVPQ